MITTQLPGGFTGTTAEMFGCDGILTAITEGVTVQVIKHDRLRTKIFHHLISRPSVHKHISKWVGNNADDQINRYGMCLWGAFDMNPDVNEYGELSVPEFVQCSQRGKCPFEGLICNGASCNKKLSPAENRILPYLLFADRIIGEMLRVSPFTVKTQLKSIKRKLNIQTKAQLIDWAKDNGIQLCK